MDNTYTISADNLQPKDQMVIPPTPQDTTDYNQTIAPITTGLANEFKTIDTNYQNLLNQQQQAGQGQIDIMAALTGRTADLQTAQEQAGVNTETENLRKYTEQLANLNAQASALNREAQAIPIQLQQESQGRGRTEAGVAPLQAARLRENALRALSIGQQADIAAAAATGSQLRLNAAKEKAQQVVDLKYKPLEDQLAIKKQTYELNKDLLASVDKERAEALNIALRKEERDLEEKKANEKAISDLIVNASSQNAPASILERAKKAKTPMEAAMALGQYAGDYWGTKIKIAQYNNILSETAKRNAEVAAAGVGSKSTVNPQEQAKFLLDTINQANELANASGRSAGRRKLEEYTVGATDYTNLETKIRTVKNNLLTLATDPNIKKFFGPQMTEADVRNMMGAATTLDTEGQTPSELKQELARAEEIFKKFAPDYKYTSQKPQTATSWASSVQSALLSPSAGGDYGYNPNRQ